MRFCWILYVFYGIANVFANSHNAESTMLQYKKDILQTYPDSNIIYDSQNQHIEKKEESSSKITQQPYIPYSLSPISLVYIGTCINPKAALIARLVYERMIPFFI